MLYCCKLKIVLRSKTRLGKNFHLKDRIPKNLTSGVVCKYQRGLCNETCYGECVRHFNVRTCGHISISSLSKKQVKPKITQVADNLLFCNYSASCEDFSILKSVNKKFINNERKIIFKQEYYIGTIATIRKAIVIRSMLELYLPLMIAKLFSLNGLFIILSCGSA